jgi:hypothetical protein
MPEIESALPTRTSDGEIALLQARAEALSALPEADRAGTAAAWRELGAALWDLAGIARVRSPRGSGPRRSTASTAPRTSRAISWRLPARPSRSSAWCARQAAR